MITATFELDDRFADVEKAAQRATFENLTHAGAAIRLEAIGSIDVSESPSLPGNPPHTRDERRLPNAILFDAGTDDVIVGPSAARMGQSAAAHEFGEFYKGQQFDERPFMGPALDSLAPALAEMWEGTIGQ